MNATASIRRLAPLPIIAALVLACAGDERRGRTATEITSAPAPGVENMQNDVARLVRERDDAREQQRQEGMRHDQERSRLQSEIQMRQERDALAESAWGAIDTADAELKSLKERAASAPAKDRRRMEQAMVRVHDKVVAVERDARKIAAQHGPAWPNFKQSLRAAVEDLQRAVRELPE